jgi:nucleoside-diphosphate-sugar epimerase
MKRAILFGGTGFIGTHIAQHLIAHSLAQEVVLADFNPPRTDPYASRLQKGLTSGCVKYLAHDVRQPVPLTDFPAEADVIFNLAAVHREPGHEASEYFETNLKGAENVCAYASAIGVRRIVFMSSISPYGPSEEVKDERSLPAPETPYGSSKLAAEKIHLDWQQDSEGRQLLVLRPGVVFGPGEGGNVTRMLRSLVKGYFFYMGNHETRKAGGYVKELCYVAMFGLDYLQRSGEGNILLNFSMDPTPTVKEFVETICKVAGIRKGPLSVPRSLLLGISYPIDAVARFFGISQPISPVRVRKMYRSTNIEPIRLRELGYQYHYTLEQAFEDWKHDLPTDFQP